MKWREEYNLGVEWIDNAHKQLFSIIRKMIDLLEGGKKDEYVCREGIRFFKSYTLKHFAEEEAYMEEIGYAGLERHCIIHENLRSKTLPELERSLESSHYAHEEVKKFIGVCLGWLTAHVTNEDQAIVGNAKMKLPPLQKGEALLAMESVITQIIRNTFYLEAVLMNNRYSGWSHGDALFEELRYVSEGGKKSRVVIAIEERFVLATTGQMMGFRFAAVDETVRAAVRAISKTFLHRIGELMAQGSAYRMVRDELLDEEEFQDLWAERGPQNGLLFYTKEGHFAFFFDEMKDYDLPDGEEDAR